MKMTKIFAIALVVIAGSFASCKKTDDHSNVSKPNEIAAFLKKEAASTTAYRAAIIKSLSENLEWTNAKKVTAQDKLEYTVVPVGIGFKNDNNSTRTVQNYLVVRKNTTTNEVKGSIYQYVNGSENKTVVLNAIIEIVSKGTSNVSGQFTVLTVADVYIMDKFYKNGSLDKIRYTTQKSSETRTGSNCTDWWWVEYNPTTGEIISSTYLYTSCNCMELRTNPENGRIDDPENCSTGGGSDTPIAIEEFNNATDANYEYTTDWNYYAPYYTYTHAHNGWKCAKNNLGMWTITASTQWTTWKSQYDGTLIVSNIANTSTSLNIHTVLVFNNMSWAADGFSQPMLNFNNTTNPKATSVVTGTLRIWSKLPGLSSALDQPFSVRGTLNVNFL